MRDYRHHPTFARMKSRPTQLNRHRASHAWVAWLLLPAAAAWAAPPDDAQSRAYASAIHAVIQEKWLVSSRSDTLVPGSTCAALITQAPGGIIVKVDFLPDCSFNPTGQQALTRAVHLSEPLPYAGFESVFRRELSMVFAAADAADQQRAVATALASANVHRDAAESDRKWNEEVDAKRQQDAYARRCSFNLLWNMPKIQLERPVAVVVTVDRAGKVVGVASAGSKPVDSRLTAALYATPPCDPLPADVAADAKTIQVGPMRVRHGH